MDAGPQPERFYDGGTPAEPPDPGRPPTILLDRVVEDGREAFRLGRRIAYRDEEYGELLVPADLDTFTTDLTSVPMLFTWLVPKTGNHLPAALVHDGLVHPPGSDPTYLSTQGHVIDRVSADRIFRNAMRDTSTPPLRRWLVWSAVTLATIAGGSAGWSRARHLRYLVPMVLTLVVVAGLGVVATLDLFDVVSVLPWMGDQPWWRELAQGFAAAVVVPFALGMSWGRFRVAGVVTSVALALLLHVTVAIAALTVAYQAAERVAERVAVWASAGSRSPARRRRSASRRRGS